MTGLEIAALKGFAQTLWRYKTWLMIGALSAACAYQHQQLKNHDAKEALRINTVSGKWKLAVEAWQNTYIEADTQAKAQQAQRYRDVSEWQAKYQAQVTKADQKANDYEAQIQATQRTVHANNQRMQQLIKQTRQRAQAAEDAAYAQCMQTLATTSSGAPRPYRLRPAGAALEVTGEALTETGAFAEEVSSKYNELKAEYVRVLDKWAQDEQ